MTKNTSSNEINNWFEEPENRKWLSRTARTIYKDLQLGRIASVFLDRKSSISESREDTLTIIESELITLLIEKHEILEKLVCSENQQISRYIVTIFKNHCIDIARHKSQDLRKYLYKRLSDALRDSKNFNTRVSEGRHKFVEFSCSRESCKIPPLTREDLNQISFPHHKVEGLDYEAVNRNAVLLDLAEYFWHSVTQMAGGNEGWIDVWSVIEWIGLQVRYEESDATGGIEKSELPISVADNENPAEQQSLAERIPDHSSRPDKIYFDRQAVKKWAACFAERLSQKEKEICYYSWDCGKALEEIAQKLGYKSASGPHYILKRTTGRLKAYLSDLDWVNYEDQNEEATNLFLNTLFSILKESVSES